MRARIPTPISARVAVVVCLAALACSDDVTGIDNTRFSAEAPFSVSVELDGRTELDLRGVNGDVDIVGVDVETSVSISAVKRVESESQADAEAALVDLDVAVSTTAGAVTVATEQPDDTGGRVFSVDYTVVVPSELAVSIAIVNGRMIVRAIEGPADLLGVNGFVDVRDVTEDLEVELVNGDILAGPAPRPGADVRITTVNGNMRCSLPSDTSTEFSASVVNGAVSVSLPFTDASVTQTLVVGTLGAGEGTCSLRTTNGTIRVVAI